MALVGLALAGGAAVRGQSALDGFDPNANGPVFVVVVQPDGKILFGGDFTTLSPNGGGVVTRNHIARVNPDGTLDTAFNPNANDSVLSIVVQADGKILAGGQFNGANSIGGQTRNYIARLDATTGLADLFNPNANDVVKSIAVQADGKILAGGFFTSIGGQPRNHIARLDATTGLADSFNPNANNNVESIAVQADGKILAGGTLNSIGGQTRNFIARLYPGPQLAGAVSRKTHGGEGTFDVPLPLSGNVGVECRSGGATNDYQMIFNFANSVTVGSAAVTSGTGSVSSFSVSGSQVTVNLTGVTNAQTITVTLFNVNDGTNSGDVPVSMGVLVGDVNGNGAVNASDVSLTKSQVGVPVTGSNFREDVNANGVINSVDVALVKSKVGTALP